MRGTHILRHAKEISPDLGTVLDSQYGSGKTWSSCCETFDTAQHLTDVKPHMTYG